MGSEASVGSWRVDSNRLCKMWPAVLDECYAVWAAGDRVELRHPKYPPLEGFLLRDFPAGAGGIPPQFVHWHAM